MEICYNVYNIENIEGMIKMKKVISLMVLCVIVLCGCSSTKKTYKITDDVLIDGWEIKFSKPQDFVLPTGEKVVKLPAKMINNSGKSDYYPLLSAYAPDGVETDLYCVCDYFDNETCYAHTMVRDGTKIKTYMMIKYSEDGDYMLESTTGSSSSHSEVTIPVKFSKEN